ncbi:MAG: guanylate kinase [Caulobacterales bacterium 32-69-10]|nr:MAG: guanylate kinase [Caulobacterales bacterium 32-69-10]
MIEYQPRRGLMLVISSPSGAGKTSLSRRLLVDHPELTLSVSWTTRAARSREIDGREYHFVDRPRFDEMVAEDGFLEWAEVHGACYGSPRQPVLEALSKGQDVLFDIDWQGARQISAAAGPDVERVFILPPSIAELRRRLYARGQDTAEVIERRVAWAKNEIEHYREYDHVLVNEDFDKTYSDLAHIYHAARIVRKRNPWLEPLVQALLDEQI